MERRPHLKTLVGRGEFVLFRRYNRIATAFIAIAIVIAARPAGSATLLLKDGRTLEGRYAEMTSVAENPLAPKDAGWRSGTHADLGD